MADKLKVRYCTNKQKQEDEIEEVREKFKGQVLFENAGRCTIQKVRIVGKGENELLRGLQTAEDIESVLLALDESLEPNTNPRNADYCTHCRADLTEYPPVGYCPECGNPPTPIN